MNNNNSQKAIEYFHIVLADTRIEVECLHRNVFYLCKDYLGSFDHADLTVSVTQQEIDARRRVFSYLVSDSTISVTTDTDDLIESTILHERIAEKLLPLNTVLMHGAVVAYDNYAYMFIAPSGTGKTTRAKIWMSEYPGSIIVNGDKPFLRVTDVSVNAYGSPWCGKEGWNTNTRVPLQSIFLLERVNNGEDSSIEEISLGKAFPILLQETYRPTDSAAMRNTIHILTSMGKYVKFFRFRSAPTVEAIRLAYDAARPR